MKRIITIKIIKILNSKREKHCHASGKGKMGYWKKNEAYGCRMCYINRKLNEAINEIKQFALQKNDGGDKE